MTSPDSWPGREEQNAGSSRKWKTSRNAGGETNPVSVKFKLSSKGMNPAGRIPARLNSREDMGEPLLKRLRSAGLVLAALLITPAFVSAQQLDCLSCHGNPGMQDSSGHSISIAADAFHASVHSALGCTACHSDIKAFPHPAHIAPVNCANCHTQEAAGVTGSVHAGAGAHSCLTCHGNPHAIVKVTDPHSPVYPLNVPRTCGTCHGNAKLAAKHHIKNVYGEYVDSIHGTALTKDGLLVAANCASCHGTHHILSRKDPRSSTYRTNIPGTCGKCHAGIEDKYVAGAHGKAMLAGNEKAPICTDCHTAHRIMEPQKTAFQETTVGKCGSCHEGKYATYRDTFHAQVSALGYTEVAHCWDCHGPHEVLPASDPRSPVNKANLVKTCGQCHKDANAKFVSYEPHADANNFHTNPALYSIRLFMDLLLWSVLGFFAIHTILWFMRLQVAHWKGQNPEDKDHE